MRCPADERVLSSVHPALIDIGARPYRSDMGTWVHGSRSAKLRYRPRSVDERCMSIACSPGKMTTSDKSDSHAAVLSYQ